MYEVATLAADGWAVTFGTARRGLGGAIAVSSHLMYSFCNKQTTCLIRGVFRGGRTGAPPLNSANIRPNAKQNTYTVTKHSM